MLGLKLVEGVIPALPSGDYAIFKDGTLIDLIGIDNSDSAYGCLLAVIGSDEIFHEEGFLKGTITDGSEYIIINSEFVKLH